MTWKEAIKRVLEEAGEPLHYTEIARLCIEKGYFVTEGATPHASANSQISMDIQGKGERSDFFRSEPGIFGLSKWLRGEKGAPPVIEDVVRPGLIRSCGLFWRRDFVDWEAGSELNGSQSGAATVNFWKQTGLYLLYGAFRPVYVGRATRQTLGDRLKAHTRDDLAGRWEHFSWFGLRDVNENGSLEKEPAKISVNMEAAVAELEALLIETVEPPRNMRRGDWNVSRFNQVYDVRLVNRGPR